MKLDCLDELDAHACNCENYMNIEWIGSKWKLLVELRQTTAARLVMGLNLNKDKRREVQAGL
jgi:hypothetical protein